MDREILFRGKRIDNGEWVEGYPCAGVGIDAGKWFLLAVGRDYLNSHIYQVDPATIVQYTGLTDKNGKKIFEGDVVECVSWNEFFSVDGEPMKPFQRRMEIVFHEGAFCMKETYGGEIPPSHFDLRSGGRFSISGDLKVIGNIHDNPELMEGD